MHIIIIGKSPSWRDAPQDGTGETWGVNDLCLSRNVDLVFNIHKYTIPSVFDPNDDGIQAYIQTIDHVNRNNLPMVTYKKEENIPTSIRFPIEEMHCEYFTGSIPYMIAYAIYKGATEVEIYGVGVKTDSKYADMRPCIEYWIGYANGKGVKVTPHQPTTLLECDKRYGLSQEYIE